MAELKTQPTKASVVAFLKSVEPKEKREDALALLKIFKEVTGEKPVMWGASIVGFGKYHYKSLRSTQERDWPLTGFSPRKQSLTVYIMFGFQKYGALLKKLGRHKVSDGSCLYINRLEDVDVNILKMIIKKSVDAVRTKYRA